MPCKIELMTEKMHQCDFFSPVALAWGHDDHATQEALLASEPFAWCDPDVVLQFFTYPDCCFSFSFNKIATNSRSRANWRDMATNMSCGGDTFICGLEIYMDGKFEEIRKSSQPAPLSFEEFTVTESSNGGQTIQFEEKNSEDSNIVVRPQ